MEKKKKRSIFSRPILLEKKIQSFGQTSLSSTMAIATLQLLHYYENTITKQAVSSDYTKPNAKKENGDSIQ